MWAWFAPVFFGALPWEAANRTPCDELEHDSFPGKPVKVVVVGHEIFSSTGGAQVSAQKTGANLGHS
jgi:hypothetical protein